MRSLKQVASYWTKAGQTQVKHNRNAHLTHNLPGVDVRFMCVWCGFDVGLIRSCPISFISDLPIHIEQINAIFTDTTVIRT